jgi:hypothetical protein
MTRQHAELRWLALRDGGLIQCSFWLEIKAELEDDDYDNDDVPLLAALPVAESASSGSAAGAGMGAEDASNTSEGKKKALKLDGTVVSQKLPEEDEPTHNLCVEISGAKELMDTSLGVAAQDPYITVALLPNKYQLQRIKPSTGGGMEPIWSAIHQNIMFFDLAHAGEGGGGGEEENAPSGICIEIWASNVAVDRLIGTCAFTFPVERLVSPRAGNCPMEVPGPRAGSKWSRLDESWRELAVNTGGVLECQIYHVSTDVDVSSRQRKRQVGIGQRLSNFFVTPPEIGERMGKADAAGSTADIDESEETCKGASGGSGREVLIVTVLAGKEIDGSGTGPAAASIPRSAGGKDMLRQSMTNLGSAIGLSEGRADPYVVAHLMSSTSSQKTLPAMGGGLSPSWSENQQNSMRVRSVMKYETPTVLIVLTALQFILPEVCSKESLLLEVWHRNRAFKVGWLLPSFIISLP